MIDLLRDPNVAVGALLGGLLVGCVEFIRPGWVGPGVVGASFIMLGIAGLWELGVNWLGAALILAAIALVVADSVAHWHGVGAITAAAMVAAGIRLLVLPRPSWGLSLAGSAALLLMWRLLQFAIQARANKFPT